MRTLNYDQYTSVGDPSNIFGCCDCGVCTYYACNMGLSPHKMVTALKIALAKKGVLPKKNVPSEVSDFREYRKIPEKRFSERLGVLKYDKNAPLVTDLLEVDNVRIYLKQHIGEPAIPIVAKGDNVKCGNLIGIIEEGKLGAYVHSSIEGKVLEVTNQYIDIAK
jgi:Na+-translocating ferredoxin:NAD+ oxidoreductase RnfC subunit